MNGRNRQAVLGPEREYSWSICSYIEIILHLSLRVVSKNSNELNVQRVVLKMGMYLMHYPYDFN